MAYDPGALEAALSAALGDDAALLGELRTAFLDSAATHLAALEAARLGPEWIQAGWRLKGLAASFGATAVMSAVDATARAAPGDPAAVARVRTAIATFAE